MKILYITPHLSTGGLPQYLNKKIENLINYHEIYVVEYNNISHDFVVQRNQIINQIGSERLFTLDDNTHFLLPNIINDNNFNIIHFEEFSESFIVHDILKKIYTNNRTYKIIETTHSSQEQQKIFIPDAFVFVSSAHIKMYEKYNVSSSIVEYPIDYKQKSPRIDALNRLGLDPNKKHVLNVGLFTPGKNQGEIFEYAKHLPDHVFHFVGNQASNFEFYWGDLMRNKPDNCIVWGERNDVDLFYDAADLFLFTSKFELSPLVIREAISWGLPILMYDLPIYNNDFNEYKNITYLSSNLQTNLQLIKGEPLDLSSEIVVITAHIDSVMKEAVLVNLIKTLTKLNYDIMLVSHNPISEHILNMVKYSVIDSKNELLYRKDYAKYNIDVHLYNVNANRKLKKVALYNHGYAVWTLWRNAHEFLVNTEYEKIHIVDYDTEIVDNRFLNRAYNLLSANDFVVYKSDDFYTNERYVTSLFSYNKNINIFDYFKTLDEYFTNKFSTTLLEDIFYKVLSNKEIKTFALEQNDIEGFGTKVNLIVGDNSAVNELSTTDYTLNFYFYNDQYNILYLANCKQNITIDGQTYYNPGFEKFYLIPKRNEHIITDTIYTRNIDMLDHGKFNTIEVYNPTILIPYEKPKIRIVHMVTDPNNNPREQESISNISEFVKSFDNVDYYMQVSEPYKQLPPAENCANPDWIAMEPGNQKLSPGHYGCYLAHKNAISIPENNDYDMIIVFEGDAIITTDHQTLYDNLLRWKNIADEENMNLIGFGNVCFDSSSNEREDLYINVNTFIPAHAYFVTNRSIPIVVNAYNTTKWQATDLWMTNVSGLRKAITKTIYSQQIPGYSLIDKKIKNKNNDLQEIYSA